MSSLLPFSERSVIRYRSFKTLSHNTWLKSGVLNLRRSSVCIIRDFDFRFSALNALIKKAIVINKSCRFHAHFLTS